MLSAERRWRRQHNELERYLLYNGSNLDNRTGMSDILVRQRRKGAACQAE